MTLPRVEDLQPWTAEDQAALAVYPGFFSTDGFRWYQGKDVCPLCARAAAEIVRLQEALKLSRRPVGWEVTHLQGAKADD